MSGKNAPRPVATWRVRSRPESIRGQVRDTWKYRRLYPFFVRNAIRSVYQAAILGYIWLFIRPFVMAMIAVVVMRDLLGVDTGPIPYLVFVLTSFTLWLFFQRGLTWGTRSFQQQKRLMTRFAFPTLLLHGASLGPGMVEAGIVLCVASVASIFYVVTADFSLTVGWHTLAVVPAFMLAALLVIAVTSVTTVLNNMARDTWYVFRYLIMIWTLATPVYYPRSAVPAPYDEYIRYNPMTPIVELFRWAVFHTEPMDWEALWIACGTISALLVVGLWVFAKLERKSLGVG